jgi:glycerol transport system substrate-binding protein
MGSWAVNSRLFKLGQTMRSILWRRVWASVLCAVLLIPSAPQPAAAHTGVTLTTFVLPDTQEAAIEKWADTFEHSTLTRQERIEELRWFARAARPFRGRSIKSVAEDIRTHYWESEVLAQAFEEITGIHVEHEIIGEGSVVERLVEQESTGRRIYDIYVNDADLIGTHLRSQGVVNLTEYMAGEGHIYTNPYLDLDDFLNLEFGQDFDGNQLQLPDQQFANLYWFRYDWFTDPSIQRQFKAIYGYDLGVPVNWAAYEDIARFFTYEVNGNGTVGGRKVYGHIDYARKSPSLGWRFTDAWLSIAGVGDVGLPNGSPVDEWGIRTENRIPVGASVERGGEVNGPAAVYALTKYIDWLEDYAPPEARNWLWEDANVQAARGDIAQNIFQYVNWLSDDAYHRQGSPVVGEDGLPVWRVAPTPHGQYWDEGMKVGYQDAGSWTIPKNVRGQRRAMAWLWAQFAVSKTVAVDKFLVGGTPIRLSTVYSEYVIQNKARWGGLIEFYQSTESLKWTGTGLNVPDYPTLSALWWPNIARAVDGELTPQQAMDAIAQAMDLELGRMHMAQYSPMLNPPMSKGYWLAQPGSPKPVRSPSRPETISYEALLRMWTQPNHVRQAHR